jgi:hypothetical protein
MSVEQLWHRYAATWSLDEQTRPGELGACVADGVVYADPNGVVEGANALSAYMSAFRQQAPGAAFDIVAVQHHHDRSLARWQLCAADGQVLQTGTSSATHAADGRLDTVNGFFDPGRPA